MGVTWESEWPDYSVYLSPLAWLILVPDIPLPSLGELLLELLPFMAWWRWQNPAHDRQFWSHQHLHLLLPGSIMAHFQIMYTVLCCRWHALFQNLGALCCDFPTEVCHKLHMASLWPHISKPLRSIVLYGSSYRAACFTNETAAKPFPTLVSTQTWQPSMLIDKQVRVILSSLEAGAFRIWGGLLGMHFFLNGGKHKK